jgi:hypothetical protein
LPNQEVKIHKNDRGQKYSIGGKKTSAPIYWQNHNLFLENARRIKFADFLGGSPPVVFSKIYKMRQYTGAVITKKNILFSLCLFVMISPINKAEASGNGNRFF